MNSISPTSSGLSQLQLATQVSTRIAAKTLDVARSQGDAAIALIQSAAKVADPDHDGDTDGPGKDVDPTRGKRLDVTA